MANGAGPDQTHHLHMSVWDVSMYELSAANEHQKLFFKVT